jgi:hypothetical protein
MKYSFQIQKLFLKKPLSNHWVLNFPDILSERINFTKNNNKKNIQWTFENVVNWIKTQAMRDELENMVCILKEVYHCRMEWEHSILQMTYTVWSPCYWAGSPFHSWQSRRNCSWSSQIGDCKPGFHALDLSVLYRSQLKEEPKSVLFISHLA